MGVERLKRPLSPQERDLVRWLIKHSHIDARHLLGQIDRLTVAGKCNCGCPTIYFALDGEPVSRKGEQLTSDWLAKVGGGLVGVMLFQTKGQISSLEVYSCAGTDKPFGLPAIDTIMGYENVTEHQPETDQ
jgi:hypothetical protein